VWMMAGGRRGGGGGGRSNSSVACCVVLLVIAAADEGGTRCHAARCWSCLGATAGLGAADLLGPWCEHGPAWLLCKVGLSVRGILSCLTRQDGKEDRTNRMRNEGEWLECVVVRPLGRQPPTQMPITTSTTPKLHVGPLDVGGKTVGKNSVRGCDSGADEAPQAPIGAHTACIRQLVVSIAALHRSLKYHLSQYKNDQQLSGTQQTGGSQTTSQHLDSTESCSKRPCTPAAAAGQPRQQAAGGVKATPAGCSWSAAGCCSWLDSTATTGSSCFFGYTRWVQVSGR
jgi:hypothetical protein